MMKFARTLTDDPTPDHERASILEKPVFGANFTDHMALATWTAGVGWHAHSICALQAFELHPGAAALHYGQEIFEGLKAYRQPDGGIALFRPEKNAARFAASARRLAMAPLDEDDFVAAVTELVDLDRDWVPSPEGEQSLYIRPFEVASETLIGVRAAQEYTFCVIASPVGPYYPEPVTLWATPNYTRAAEGGTGAAKCGGNYASSLIAQYEGAEHGCSQVLFGDAGSGVNTEELGGMNLMVVTADGELITPALTGTILEGVTRDSILTVAADLGLRPVQRVITLAEIFDRVDAGEIVEAFACGTAAVLTPVAEFRSRQGDHVVGAKPGERTMQIRSAILDIQYGRAADSHGWMRRVV